MKVINRTRRQTLAEDAVAARGFWQKFRGLMGRPSLSPGEGLVLFGESSIHSFFMRFPIDVLYLNTDRQVVRVQRDMAPWRIGPLVRDSSFIVELPPGTIDATQSAVGDHVEFE